MDEFDQIDQFEEFPKIARLSREIVITEKIDGTNAQVFIDDLGRTVRAGSRTRWLDTKSKSNDNHGFARWVEDNKEELLKLGPGRHFGEWWGQGIQRGYGLREKRFSLFNTQLWGVNRPSCCHVVPVLYVGPFTTDAVDLVLSTLAGGGSAAAPGFMRPEGVIVFHTQGRVLFKKTIEKDDQPKGKE